MSKLFLAFICSLVCMAMDKPPVPRLPIKGLVKHQDGEASNMPVDSARQGPHVYQRPIDLLRKNLDIKRSASTPNF